MNAYDALPENVTEIFGEEARAERAYDLLTVDVPLGAWIGALEIARDKLGCTYFDWLSAVDEPGTGFRVSAHVVALEGRTVRRLLVRTTVPHTAPVLPTAVEIYAGASWHERETHEMFGIDFTDHPHLAPLLLPDSFEGHPLRKDFVLAARVAKAWPGAKEPGESEHGGPKRRQMLPPGVPDPNEWGPLKGQLPPAPARPTRGARAGAAATTGADRPTRTPGTATPATTDRPPRRSRATTDGSASQTPPPTTDPAAPASAAPDSTDPAAPASAAPDSTDPAASAAPAATPRRSRSAADGSASQAAPAPAPATPDTPAAPPRRTRSTADGSASQGENTTEARPKRREPATDAPWHNPKPAFSTDGDPTSDAAPVGDPEPGSTPEATPGPESDSARPTADLTDNGASAPEGDRENGLAPESDSASGPESGPEPAPDPTANPKGTPKPPGPPDHPTTPAGGDPA
ncbi:NADH-quinone oxidoreductase subunit C [Streptomyces sp. NPDC051561]|uniref:NADH-quinone oxidoreductase subunit C n=1 Tax=Streptomyces sp. NPDC051561 TaxID=3365658 RepID=UPI003797CB4F